MKNIALIPARSGSKGLKDKNIRLLRNKPMLAYSIEAALQSEMFDEIHVSTDSEEYARIAVEYGASVPFLREKELARDNSGTWEVVRRVLERYKQDYQREFHTLTLLQPTSPLRIGEDIVAGYEIFKKKNANTVVSVEKMQHSPEECNTLPSDGRMDEFVKEEHVKVQRQKLPQYYRINGALYITKVKQLEHVDDIYRDKCFAYIMPAMRSVDIDTVLDFEYAEFLLEKERQ